MQNRIRNLLIGLFAAVYMSATSANSDEPNAATPPASMLGDEAGQVRDDNGLKMKLVWCPPGVFILKSKNVVVMDASHGFLISARSEVASERAVIFRGYWLARFETTQGEWKRLMNSEPWKGKEKEGNGFPAAIHEGDAFPASFINWNDALTFCAEFTKQEREAGRLGADWEYSLPTEAQWEHACRARSETQFFFGDDLSALPEYACIGREGAEEVGRKKPNAWGLYDTYGNLFEWTREPAKGLMDVRGPEETAQIAGTQVIRGGGWNAMPEFCTSSHRVLADAERRSAAIGFRVALTPVRPAADNPPK